MRPQKKPEGHTMPDKCTDNIRDCPLLPRVEALERSNEQHSATHREIFGRLGAVERDNAVQEAHYRQILEKLDALTARHDALNAKLEALEAKPGKRWEALVEKTIWAVAAAVIAFLLARVGL